MQQGIKTALMMLVAIAISLGLSGCDSLSGARGGHDWQLARVVELISDGSGKTQAVWISHYHGGTVLRERVALPEDVSVKVGDRVWVDHRAKPLQLQTTAPASK